MVVTRTCLTMGAKLLFNLLVVLAVSFGAAATFQVEIKNAPKGCNDIHINFNQNIANPKAVNPKTQVPLTANGENLDAQFAGNSLKKGDTYKVTVEGTDPLTVDEAWWTRDGSNIKNVDVGTEVVISEVVPKKRPLWNTGSPKIVIYNGADSYLGFSSGNIGVGLEQRWWAAPFSIFDSPAVITEVHVNYFIPAGFEGDNIRYKIWQRNGFNTPGALIQEGVLGIMGPGIDNPEIPQVDDWLHIYTGLAIPLNPGDYYFTIYGDGNTQTLTQFQNAAWLTGAANDTIAYNNNQAWRSATHPAPGFQPYSLTPAVLSPTPLMGDGREIYNVSFALYGNGGRTSQVCSGEVIWQSWVGPALDFWWRWVVQDNTDAVVAYRYPVVTAANGYEHSFTAPVSNLAPQFIDLQYRVWLNTRANIFPANPENDDGVQFPMINGDCDRDNEIAIGDFALISTAFGSFPGEPNWNEDADVDGDSEVTIGDYSIMSDNFGIEGD